MAKWQEVRIMINRTAAEGVYALLEDWGIKTYAVEDTALMDQAQELGWGDYFPATTQSEQITIICYFSSPLSEAELNGMAEQLHSLADFGFEPGEVSLAARFVAEENWAHAWKTYYTPQRIGQVLIQPSWLEVEKGKINWDMVIHLDPGMAFGSGTHPTTAMCAEFLQELNLQGKKVWDVGTGSGILAIVAAKYGAKVEAVDVDSVAVQVARENRDLNQLDFPICQGTIDALKGEADLIVANIVAHVICPMMPDVYKRLTPGGFFIASGIIEDKDQEVLASAREAGLRLLRRRQKGEWISYLFQKGE